MNPLLILKILAAAGAVKAVVFVSSKINKRIKKMSNLNEKNDTIKISVKKNKDKKDGEE